MQTVIADIGYNNCVLVDQVTAIVEYKIPSVQRLIASVRKDKPRNVLNLCDRKHPVKAVIILTGDRYILSPLTSVRLFKRFEGVD